MLAGYGISFETSTEILYCSSASHTRNIDHFGAIENISIFAKFKNAEKALKELRLGGIERKFFGKLAVVEIHKSVGNTIEIPLPKGRTGYVIQQGDFNYYDGIKARPNALYHYPEIERATVFKTKKEAEKMLNALKQKYLENYIYDVDKHDEWYSNLTSAQKDQKNITLDEHEEYKRYIDLKIVKITNNVLDN